MEICRRRVVDQEQAHDPVVGILPVAVRDLERGLVVATLPVDPAARGPAVVTWLVAARGLAVGPRQVIWGTFLICQGRAEAVHIVPAPEPLQGVPLRLPPAALRQISCMTGHQRNPAGVPDHARVPVTLPRMFRDLARVEVEFNVPPHYRDKMVVEFSVLLHDPVRMAAEYSVPRRDQDRMVVEFNVPPRVPDKTAAEFNVPRRDQDRMVAESNVPRHVQVKMVAAFNVQYDPTTAAGFQTAGQIVGRIVPVRAVPGNDGNRATGPIIGPTASMIGTNGTIGARTITSRSTITGATIGVITTIGLITIGGTITIILTSIGTRTLTGGVGRPSAP
jgi:hypothetical protein